MAAFEEATHGAKKQLIDRTTYTEIIHKTFEIDRVVLEPTGDDDYGFGEYTLRPLHIGARRERTVLSVHKNVCQFESGTRHVTLFHFKHADETGNGTQLPPTMAKRGTFGAR